MTGFAAKSYQVHSDHYQQYLEDGQLNAHARTWLDEGSVDRWVHDRMLSCLDPLLHAAPQGSWLTVGDGRIGLDAQYIEGHGCTALATDISTALLAWAKENGLIREYRMENAEKLSFSENAFDFVLCKESLHHFPRPMIALYEMLRVARQAVVLIEPNDRFHFTSLRQLVFSKLKDLLFGLQGKTRPRHTFEEVGNYEYHFSVHDLERAAIGLDLECLAVKAFNFGYLAGIENEQASENGPLFRRVRRRLAWQDLMVRLGLNNADTLCSVLFKKMPSEEMQQALRSTGFQIHSLPRNPYLG